MAIAKLSIDIEARLANFEKSLDKVARSSEGMASKVKNSFSALSATVGAAIGALAVGGAVTAFRDMTLELDRMAKSAQALGLTTETLSALEYAAGMAGVEANDLSTALGKLSVKAQEAAQGNKQAVELFRDLGVSVNDSSGNLKAADVLLGEVADRFAKFEDGSSKAALAIDLFGRSGAKLIPLLNGGSSGLEEMRVEAEKLGGIIDSKLAKQSEAFNDNLSKLGTLTGTAGKALAGNLLPWLNEVAEGFLISAKNAESFFEILSRPISGLSFFDVNDKLVEARKDLDALEVRRQGLLNEGLNTAGVESDIAKIKRTIEYYKELQRNQALAGGDNYGNEGRGLTSGSGKLAITRTAESSGKAGKVASPEATAEAKVYASAMEALAKSVQSADMAMLDLSGSQKQIYELMTSPAWASMPDTWKQTAVAQFEQAYAAEQAAAATAQLNRLLGATESSKIEEARDDMLALVEALEQGVISEEKYLEAVAARLGKGTQEIEKQKSLAEELGLTFTSAFEDAIAGGKGFSDVLKGLEQDILRLLTRKAITEPLMNAVSSVNWGGLVGSFFGTSQPTTGGTFNGIRLNADGNVYSMPSLSAYSGTVVSQPTFFANGGNVMGEAGPEGIFPLKRGADGKLGVVAHGAGGGDVTVNVINNTDAQARTERRTDGRGNSIIDVVIERTKAAIASDIGSGNGAVPAAMQSSYGLKRTAGAY